MVRCVKSRILESASFVYQTKGGSVAGRIGLRGRREAACNRLELRLLLLGHADLRLERLKSIIGLSEH